MRIDVYPRMAPDSADYLHPSGYKTRMKQKEQKLEIIHCLEYENTLPAQWLSDGRADLCCEVRVPQMLYSHRFRCEHSNLEIPKKGPLEFSSVA